jgi:hypothetical protein
MSKSPLILLRKAAPGSLVVNDLVEFFRRKRYPRTDAAIGAFERGFVSNPEERFFEVYAGSIGVTVEAVKRAHRATIRWRQRQDPPQSRVA